MRMDVSGHWMTFGWPASDFNEAAPAAISILRSFLPLVPGLSFADPERERWAPLA